MGRSGKKSAAAMTHLNPKTLIFTTHPHTMKLPPTHASPLLRAALSAALLLPFVVPLRAAPGELDVTWNPNASARVRKVAIQPDGMILAAGTFNTIGGQTRPGLARLNTTNGQADAAFNATANTSVYSLVVLPDGKLWTAGSYSSIGGLSRANLARLNADGTADAGLVTNTDVYVESLGLQENGKLLVGGGFGMASFAGAGGNGGLRRLNANGTPDTAFLNATNGGISTLLPLPDGKVLVGGGWTTIGGPVWRFLAVCNGTTAAVQAPNFNIPSNSGGVRSCVVQPDGKILVGGPIWGLLGQNRFGLGRLNADFTLDTSFLNPDISGINPNFPPTVADMALQTDGKIIIGGAFSSVGGQSRNRIARLNADGTLDTTFNAGTVTAPGDFSGVDAVALTADGRIIVGGEFTSIGGTTRNRIARLLNDPATQSLTFTPSRIEWLRGGSSPEAEWVTFEQSTDAGATWTLLGNGTRISGGWELTGLSLPGGAQVRARARVRGSYIDETGPLISPSPEIVVEQPTSTDLVDGTASIAYGSIFTGGGSSKTFTIKNTGSSALSVTGVSVTGGNSGDFTVSSPSMPLNVAADDSETFTVSFNPTVAGARATTLQILSDDADEATFDIALTGTGVAAPEIAVEHPVGTDVPTLSTITMGSFTEGSSSPAKTFTLKNNGSGTLNVTSMAMSFGNNADFTLSTPGLPFSVAPSDSVTFTATFTPLGIGARSAYITIGNNDANENPFYVQLAGTGLEVVDSAPVITSGLTGSAFISNFFSYQITATDAATVFAAAPLPPGLTLNSSTGAITGSPTATGVYNIALSAANEAFGVGPTATLVLTITDPLAPLKEAIELTPGIPVSTWGTWTAQTAVTHDGVDAITASPSWFDFARITFNVQGPATFSCWWKANSGDASNSAWIRLDGFAATIASISAENSAWKRVEYAIPAGAHTVEITMDRFSGTFGSAATIWLDEVSFVFPSPDADTDGLPDAWEVANFGSAGATDGAADADGDGLNNFGEYAFGLNPNSGDLTGLPQATLSGGLMTLTVTKQPYVAYTVEATGDLSAGSWSTAGLTVVTDNASTLTVQETATTTRRQLRVRAVPAP